MDKKYIILHKPYGMLSQFTQEHENQRTLAELNIPFPDVYAVGRLDADSEGLLLLSNDNQLIKHALQPEKSTFKTYWVQVDNDITQEAIQELEKGVTIKHKGSSYHTLPCKAKRIAAPNLPERVPPIRERKNIPTSWIEIQLQEGKNRQVRKMTASVGFPTLRLIRVAIGGITLGKLQPEQFLELQQKSVYQKLGL